MNYTNLFFCVSNVAENTTDKLLSSFITDGLGIKVLSCGAAKTKFKNTLSFRVCIAAADKDRFLDPDFWPCNIVVRSWVWKGKKMCKQI